MKAMYIGFIQTRMNRIVSELSSLEEEMTQWIGSKDVLDWELFFHKNNLQCLDVRELMDHLQNFKTSLEQSPLTQTNANLWESLKDHFRTNVMNNDAEEEKSVWEMLKPIADQIPFNTMWSACMQDHDYFGDPTTRELAEHIFEGLYHLAKNIDLGEFDIPMYVREFGLIESLNTTSQQLLRLPHIDQVKHIQSAIVMDFILVVLAALGYDTQSMDVEFW